MTLAFACCRQPLLPLYVFILRDQLTIRCDPSHIRLKNKAISRVALSGESDP